MSSSKHKLAFKCVRSLLRPVVRFCLRNTLSIQEVIEALKLEFIDIASQEFQSKRIQINTSKLIVATGIHRKDVLRIWNGEVKEEEQSHLIRVISHWNASPDYRTKQGKPRTLECKGDTSEFHTLVREVCRDVHPKTILSELTRIGAVEATKRGLKLKTSAYSAEGDPEESCRMYAEDAQTLLLTIDENAHKVHVPANLHVRTTFDNISLSALSEIRVWLYKKGNQFHKEVETYPSRFDLDLNPDAKAPGKGIVKVASFSHLIDPDKGIAGSSNSKTINA